MVAAPLLTVGVPIELPKTAAAPLPTEKEEPLTIALTADGLILVQNERGRAGQADPAAAAVSEERKSGKIFLRADGAIPYEGVMQVMGALNASGFNDIGLVTEQGGPKFDGRGRLDRSDDADRHQDLGNRARRADRARGLRPALVRAARARADPGDRRELRLRGGVRGGAGRGPGRGAARRGRAGRAAGAAPGREPAPEPRRRSRPPRRRPTTAPEVAALEPPAAPRRRRRPDRVVPQIITLAPPTAATPPQARPAPRVEPEPTPPPPEAVRPAETPKPVTAPDAGAARWRKVEEPPAAPPEAAPEAGGRAAPPAPLALETSGRPMRAGRRRTPARAGAARQPTRRDRSLAALQGGGGRRR